MFTDRVVIECTAGKGGNGVVAWTREKYIPKGGPAGGDGGNGGAVILQVCEQLPSLEYYRHRRILKAENGVQGGSNNRRGRNGQDLIIKVPAGTLVKNAETGEILQDLTINKQKWLLCKGGRGGKGNSRFKSPTNRAPQESTDGTYGESHRIELELKLIADVGLVGFPNAGKSTLISRLTYVPVKIAPYPFTTLRPNLGYITGDSGQRILLADIPGIIEGAHENRGLGLEFLRHIERTRFLLFVIDCSALEGRDPLEDFSILRREIECYNPEILNKPYALVLNKIDCESAEEHITRFKAGNAVTLFPISALTGEGCSKVLEYLKQFIAN